MRKSVNERWAGQRFGRLCILNAWVDGIVTRANCVCDCGKKGVYRVADMKSGNTSSCGCRRVENSVSMRTTHGMTYSSEYSIWTDIKKRCSNSSHKHYRRYGGRGISVCDRWQNSFEHFYEDMGPKPSTSHQIDRINNDGNYEPANCRWATRRENMLNTGRAMLAEYQGKQVYLKDLAMLTGVKYGTLYYRFKRGQPVLTETEKEAVSRTPFT